MPPRQKCRSIQRRGPSIQIRLLTNLGIESRTLMFHLVKSRWAQSGLAAVWKKKKSLSPHAKANPQHSLPTSDAKIYTAKEDDRAEDWDWQTHCLLYWTGVPLPRQPAAPGWYLERQVELLQRISCSARIWEVSSHGAVVFALHPFYFRLIRSSSIITSQINRSCSSTQQPVLLNYQRIVSFRHSFHNNNFSGSEDVGMVFTYLLRVLSHFCMLN